MGNLYNAERICRVTKDPIVLVKESVRLSRKTDREAITSLRYAVEIARVKVTRVTSKLRHRKTGV